MLITDHLKDQRADSPDTARHPSRATEPRVLIADDQADVLEALRLLLKAEGFVLETASSPAGVLAGSNLNSHKYEQTIRSELVWRVMRRNPHVLRGLRRAGFSGGWLDQVVAVR